MAISKEDYFNLKEYWDYQRLLQYNRELLKQRLAKMQGSVFTQLGPMYTSDLYDKIWVEIWDGFRYFIGSEIQPQAEVKDV